MLWRKCCPRCRGDLVLDSDFYGPYVSCIQCGNILGEQRKRFLPPRTTPRLPEARPGNVRPAAAKSGAAAAG
jgi:hypothetical protein